METAEKEELQGSQTVILALENKSVKPYATQDEYLYAMKEDLAEWFHTLYGLDITVDNFFEQLETGVVMCQHANNVQSFIREQLERNPPGASGAVHPPPRGRAPCLPERGVQYRTTVKPGSFQSRDNVSNFIAWCRGLGINDVVLFETEDLVLRKNERHVVLCLLEVARRGAQYGMLAPTLVQMEREIDAEMAGHAPVEPPPQRKTCDLMSLDEMVREMVSLCTCPDQFPMVKVSDGKYKIGDSQTLIFVRILRNHVMVRIGGGWDTLENYLDRHDPCRCTSRGHKGRMAGMTSQTPVRRQSAPAQQILDQRMRSSTPSTDRSARSERAQTPSKQVPGPTPRSKRSQSVLPQPSSSGEPHKRSPQHSAAGGSTSLVHRSLDPAALPSLRSGSPAPEGSGRRVGVTSMSRDSALPTSRSSHHSPTDGDSGSEAGRSSCGGSPGLHKRFSSASDLEFPKEMTLASTNENKLPRPRPTSARDRARQSKVAAATAAAAAAAAAAGVAKGGGSSETSGRGRMVAKPGGRQVRSRSVEPIDLSAERVARRPSSVNKTSSSGYGKAPGAPSDDVLMISRDSTGKHRLGLQSPNGDGSADMSDGYRSGSSRHSSTSSSLSGQTGSSVNTTTSGAISNGLSSSFSSNGGGPEDKRPGTPRVNISPDRILPDKPKLMSRSHTADLGHLGEDSTDTETDCSQPRTSTRMSVSSNQSSTLSLASSFDDYPEPPPEDWNLNAQMERLFEEYRQQEMRERALHSSRRRHRRSNSADLLEMDDMYDRQRVHAAFKKARSSSRDMLTDRPGTASPGSSSRVRSRRSSNASVDSNPSTCSSSSAAVSTRGSSGGGRRAGGGTPTPTPTRTSSLRGALGMNRDLRNKLTDPSSGRATPTRSSSLNTHHARPTTPSRSNNNTTSRVVSRGRSASVTPSASSASGVSHRRSQSRDATERRGGSQAGSRAQSRDSSLTRTRPSSALGHSDADRRPRRAGPKTNTTPHPSGAHAAPSLAPRAHSREDLLDTSPTRAVPNGRPRSQSTTGIYPEDSGLSPDGRYSTSPDMPSAANEWGLLVDVNNDGGDSGGEAHTPKPRKDKRLGRTRIPMPVNMLSNSSKYDGADQPLRRYDSGVDINNMSPTESSVQGDDAWQQELILPREKDALQLANQALAYHVTGSPAKGKVAYDDIF